MEWRFSFTITFTSSCIMFNCSGSYSVSYSELEDEQTATHMTAVTPMTQSRGITPTVESIGFGNFGPGAPAPAPSPAENGLNANKNKIGKIETSNLNCLAGGGKSKSRSYRPGKINHSKSKRNHGESSRRMQSHHKQREHGMIMMQ